MKNLSKTTIAAVSLISLLVAGCSSGNLDDVKSHAEERWSELGYDVVGYDGFQWGLWGFNDYGGAEVWYLLEKKGVSNGITYGGYLQKWGDEYHMYALRAYDAIKP